MRLSVGHDDGTPYDMTIHTVSRLMRAHDVEQGGERKKLCVSHERRRIYASVCREAGDYF